MARPTRTIRLAALLALAACSLIALPVIRMGMPAPLSPAVRLALSEADRLEKAGKSLEAIALLEKRLADLPGDAMSAERQVFSIALADRCADQAAKAVQAGHPKQALDWYNKALPLHRAFKIGDAATDLRRIGNIYYGLSDYPRALDYYRQSLALSRQVGDKLGEAKVLNNTGKIHYAHLDYKRAEECYRQALPLFRQTGDKTGEAWALVCIGLVHSSLADYNQAMDYYRQALPLFKQIGDNAGAVETLNNIGLIHFYQADYNSAMDFYQQALTNSRQAGNKLGEARALLNTGNVYITLSDYSRARDLLNQALPIFKQIQDKPGQAEALTSIGRVFFNLSDYTKAMDYYHRSLLLFQQAGDKAGEARALTNTGNVHSVHSDYARAIDSYNQALTLYRQASDKPGEARILNNIGLVHFHLSDYPRAMTCFSQALTLFQRIGKKADEAETLNNTGNVYSVLANYTRALGCYNQALELYQQVGNKPGEAKALSNTGRVFFRLADYPRAMEHYRQALPLFKQVGNKPGEAETLLNIGRVHASLTHYTQAMDFYRQALTLFRQVGHKEVEATTLYHLMCLCALPANPIHNPGLAIWYGKQAVNTYQAVRSNIRTLDQGLQKGYADSVEGTYRTLADLLISQGRLSEAQQVLDLLKQQEYFAFVRRAPAETDATGGAADLTPAEAEAERRYRAVSDRAILIASEYETLLKKQPRTETEEQRLDTLFKELAEANAVFQAFLASLDKEFAENKAVANRLDTVKDAEALTTTLARLDKEMGQKTVAVYTLVGEKSLRFLVITGGVQVARSTKIGAADLANKVFAFREALRNPKADPRPLGKELYDLLIKPIEKDLAGANAATVLWSLDGVLRYIPLAALSTDSKTYLAEQNIRHSVFTPATLSRLVNTPKANWKALAVGVSKPYDVEGVHFNALTGAEAEVSGVRALLPGQVLLNSDFSETSLVRSLRDSYPLVHIATHFYFRPGDEGRSFLLLGDGTPLLLSHLREMPATLFAGVDLLVLSACDTATGGGSSPNATGAEFESFGLLAQRKGAEAVLATLWPVADASTVLLMQEFYRIRKTTPGLTKSAALRQAQLALLTGKVSASATAATGPDTTKGVAPSSETGSTSTAPAFTPDPKKPYAHPYYWAGFVLIGNFR